jgi:hypothetical protein
LNTELSLRCAVLQAAVIVLLVILNRYVRSFSDLRHGVSYSVLDLVELAIQTLLNTGQVILRRHPRFDITQSLFNTIDTRIEMSRLLRNSGGDELLEISE